MRWMVLVTLMHTQIWLMFPRLCASFGDRHTTLSCKPTQNNSHSYFLNFSTKSLEIEFWTLYFYFSSPSNFCISHVDPSTPHKPHNVASISKPQLFPQHPEDEAQGSYLAYGNNFHRESAFVVVDITVNIVGDQTLGWFGPVKHENRVFREQEGHQLKQEILGTKYLCYKCKY